MYILLSKSMNYLKDILYGSCPLLKWIYLFNKVNVQIIRIYMVLIHMDAIYLSVVPYWCMFFNKIFQTSFFKHWILLFPNHDVLLICLLRHIKLRQGQLLSLANKIGKIGQRVWRLATGKNQHTTGSSCLEEGRAVMEAKRGTLNVFNKGYIKWPKAQAIGKQD
jgi:hypothetical protein